MQPKRQSEKQKKMTQIKDSELIKEIKRMVIQQIIDRLLKEFSDVVNADVDKYSAETEEDQVKFSSKYLINDVIDEISVLKDIID